jgi:phage tail sheath protein FI
VERGQLVVEVRVAPARPLEFITIRLVQRGEQAFTVHEG